MYKKKAPQTPAFFTDDLTFYAVVFIIKWKFKKY